MSNTATGCSSSGGTAKQVISTTKTDTFTASAASYVDVTGLTVDITPSSTGSKIIVKVHITSSNKGSFQVMYNILRNGTAIGLGTAAGSRTQSTGGSCIEANITVNTNNSAVLNMLVVDEPASVALQTYKIQVKVQSSGVAYINRAATDSNSVNVCRGTSTITVIEAEE